MKAPFDFPENYINRKGFHSVVLQAVCDHQMVFTDCYAGWPGSVHDARIFKNSDLFKRVSDDLNVMPNGSYILGDSVYPLLPWLLTPFKDIGTLTEAQKKFNFIHSSSRMVIERAFALLKGRFRRLKYLDCTLINKIPTVIIAACTLHNFCILADDEIEEYMETPSDEINNFNHVATPTTSAQYKRQQVMQELLYPGGRYETIYLLWTCNNNIYFLTRLLSTSVSPVNTCILS